jgi:hypothetical protein
MFQFSFKLIFSQNKMNNLNLTIFNSTASLSSRLIDVIYFYFIPISALLGIVIFKAMTIYVLSIILKKNKPDFIYYYLLTFEISDSIIGIILCFIGLFECGSYCSLSYNYITKLFQLIFFTYGANVALQFQTFLEITLALKRIQIFSSNKKVTNTNFKKKVFFLFILSMAVTSPVLLFNRNIIPIGILINSQNEKEEILYSIKKTDWSQIEIWKIILLIIDLIRGFLMYILLLVINIIVVIKFKIYVKNKMNKTQINVNNNQHENKHAKINHKRIKLTRMVLATSLNFALTNLAVSIAPLLYFIIGNSLVYNYYTITVSIMSIFIHVSYIFLYCRFNPLFRNTLYKIFFK